MTSKCPQNQNREIIYNKTIVQNIIKENKILEEHKSERSLKTKYVLTRKIQKTIITVIESRHGEVQIFL